MCQDFKRVIGLDTFIDPKPIQRFNKVMRATLQIGWLAGQLATHWDC